MSSSLIKIDKDSFLLIFEPVCCIIFLKQAGVPAGKDDFDMNYESDMSTATRAAMDRIRNMSGGNTSREDGTRVINGRLHKRAKDGLYDRIPAGGGTPRMSLDRDGTAYEVVDGAEYVRAMLDKGVKPVTVQRTGAVLIRNGVPGERLTAYAGYGGTESSVTQVKEGDFVLTKTDASGRPVLDKHGHTDIWAAPEQVVRRKYDVPEGAIADGMVVRAKKGQPQTFIEADRNIAVMTDRGPDGQKTPQNIRKGGMLNITDLNDIYGVGKKEFSELYGPADRTVEEESTE